MSGVVRDVFLAVGAGLGLLSCVGAATMSDEFERLHFGSTISTLAAFAVAAAVNVQEGFGQATLKSWLCFVLLLLGNSVLSHATARAAAVHHHASKR